MSDSCLSALRAGNKWSSAEDKALLDAVQTHGADWDAVAQQLPRRTPIMCRNRWEGTDGTVYSKSHWTADEDMIIAQAIADGVSKWSLIAKRLENRNGKQCRDRWFNHLDPNLKKTPWTAAEDDVLISAQSRLGNFWTKIATELPGRSENEVKNRWYSATIRKRVSKPSPQHDPPTEAPKPSLPCEEVLELSTEEYSQLSVGWEYLRGILANANASLDESLGHTSSSSRCDSDGVERAEKTPRIDTSLRSPSQLHLSYLSPFSLSSLQTLDEHLLPHTPQSFESLTGIGKDSAMIDLPSSDSAAWIAEDVSAQGKVGDAQEGSVVRVLSFLRMSLGVEDIEAMARGWSDTPEA